MNKDEYLAKLRAIKSDNTLTLALARAMDAVVASLTSDFSRMIHNVSPEPRGVLMIRNQPVAEVVLPNEGPIPIAAVSLPIEEEISNQEPIDEEDEVQEQPQPQPQPQSRSPSPALIPIPILLPVLPSIFGKIRPRSESSDDEDDEPEAKRNC